MSITPEVLEGTWEEISRQASKLDAHRLRVTILPDSEKEAIPPASALPSTGRYAARVRAALAEEATVAATPEEEVAAEREMQELMNNLNQNRLRGGADPLF